MRTSADHAPKEAQDDKFPVRLAFGVWIVQLYNGIQYAEIFVLAVYVVRRFEGPDATEQRIGQLAGLLAAASSFAVGTAAWPWGKFSDRIGRKKVILIGNCATAACIIMFSTARTYWVALLSRLIAGLLDGSLVMTKVMVGESCCSSYMQAKVMSYLALGDAMGNIIGPALGGLLSDPCPRFSFLRDTSFCGKDSLLSNSPFLLPCAVTAALGIITTIINILFMEETLPRLSGQEGYRLVQQVSLGAAHDHGSEEPRRPLEPRRSLDLSAGDTQSISELLGESQLSRLQSKEIHETDSGVADMPEPKTSPRAALHSTASCTGNGESVAIEMQAPEVPRRLGTHDSVQSTLGSLPQKASSNGLDVRWEEDSDANGLEDDVEGQHLLKGGAHRPADGRPQSSASEEEDKEEEPWWRNRPLILTLLVTAWMLSIAKYNDELGPVFVSAPVKQGGLGMPLDAFALPLSFGGVVLTLFAIFGYPRLQRAVGLKMTCSLGLLLGIPGDLILPTAALFRWQPILEQATIWLAIAITKLTTQTCFTASMVIINSTAPRGQLGSVNGIRMMLAAFGRSSGPILGGVLWGYSATLNFPGHHYLGFIVASFALIGCWYLHHRIPIHV